MRGSNFDRPMEKYFDTRLSPSHRQGAAMVWGLVSKDIQSMLPAKPQHALDLGAGYGDFINEFDAPEKWAADLWPGMKQSLKPGIRAITADITNPIEGLPQDHFDLCFMSNVLEHFTVEDALKILWNVRRYCKNGAHLVLLQPNFTYCSKHYFDDYTHKTIFTAEGLSNFLLDNGFELVRVEPRYLPFSFKSRLPRPRWMVWLYLQLPWKPLAAQMLLIARVKK